MTGKNNFKKIGSSETSKIDNTKRKEISVKMPLIIMSIHSNALITADFSDGHAWISVSRDGVITNYGLWPDNHPTIKALGQSDSSVSDIRTGMEDGQIARSSRYYKLSPQQHLNLKNKLKENITWRYTNTCASWASEVVRSVTGEYIDVDDTLGFETPRRLSESIENLEKSRKTSNSNPQGIPDDNNKSTSAS